MDLRCYRPGRFVRHRSRTGRAKAIFQWVNPHSDKVLEGKSAFSTEGMFAWFLHCYRWFYGNGSVINSCDVLAGARHMACKNLLENGSDEQCRSLFVYALTCDEYYSWYWIMSTRCTLVFTRCRLACVRARAHQAGGDPHHRWRVSRQKAERAAPKKTVAIEPLKRKIKAGEQVVNRQTRARSPSWKGSRLVFSSRKNPEQGGRERKPSAWRPRRGVIGRGQGTRQMSLAEE